MSDAIRNRELIWWPERKMGYYPVEPTLFSGNDVSPYNSEYFEKYRGYARTVRGAEITSARVKFVKKFYDGEVVDVGVGCGQFVEWHKNAKGFDVNPAARLWLEERGLWCDVYNGHFCRALTFWDSLEHIRDIDLIISQARDFVFISIPIFTGPDHVLRSKHFRKDEHYWYFTHDALLRWFEERGFLLLENNRMEEDFGREDIGTYAFRRSSG